MQRVSSKRGVCHLWRLSLCAQGTSICKCTGHPSKCSCTACTPPAALNSLHPNSQQSSRCFASTENSSSANQPVPSTSSALHEQADEALRKLPRIRPPTRDAAGSEQLPIAAATPPVMPQAHTVIRRLLGENGIALQRHLEAQTPAAGSFGSVFSDSLKSIRQKGLNIDESWDGLLARWDSLLDKRQYETVLREMQEKGGRENELLTSLYRDIHRRQEADQRALRHAEVEAKRAQVAASRVVKLDEQGRAYGTGKRKTSVARVWIKPVPEEREFDGKIRINGRPFDDYIKPWMYRDELVKPFEVTETLGLFDVVANVHGGGVNGQAQAIRHGISKALQCFNPEFREYLRPEGLLTRDARVVERKKPGKAKARKSFQWVKR